MARRAESSRDDGLSAIAMGCGLWVVGFHPTTALSPPPTTWQGVRLNYAGNEGALVERFRAKKSTMSSM